VLGEDFPELRH